MPFRFLRRGRKPHVIVGHADADQRILLCRAVERWGYRVSGVVDGRQLAELLSSAFRDRSVPAAIVVSVDLPGSSVVGALQSIERWDWRTPVVLLHDAQSDIPADLLQFADGVVRPLAVHDLRRVLAQLAPVHDRTHEVPDF